MLGVFWKIQEICNKMGTRICKIVEEMVEIIERKNDMRFKKKFLLIWFESAKMKFRPYFTMELVKKLMKKT